MTKTAEKPFPLGPYILIYQYKGVPPGGNLTLCKLWDQQGPIVRRPDPPPTTRYPVDKTVLKKNKPRYPLDNDLSGR